MSKKSMKSIDKALTKEVIGLIERRNALLDKMRENFYNPEITKEEYSKLVSELDEIEDAIKKKTSASVARVILEEG